MISEYQSCQLAKVAAVSGTISVLIIRLIYGIGLSPDQNCFMTVDQSILTQNNAFVIPLGHSLWREDGSISCQ
jgi:hypothetical protein